MTDRWRAAAAGRSTGCAGTNYVWKSHQVPGSLSKLAISHFHSHLGKNRNCIYCKCLEFSVLSGQRESNPQEQHWSHLRTTNPIESTFATVRLRTQRTKGCGSRITTQAQQHWRRLNGSDLIPKVVTGAIFVDGEELTEQAA